MQATTFLSVISGAVVAAALSSCFVQLQPTSVLVTAAPAPAEVAGVPAVRTAEQPPAVAAPARPAYVQVGTQSQVVLAAGPQQAPGERLTVDVLGCSRAWSASGECLGTQAAVLRDAALAPVQRALSVPAGVPHVRVSAHGGQVAVEVTRP